jgi:hypothetical protein
MRSQSSASTRQSKELRKRAYRMDGVYVDPTIQVKENGFVWSFDLTPAGSVGYRMKVNEKGQWNEIGERSSDGGRMCQNFFEMTLDRKSAAKS